MVKTPLEKGGTRAVATLEKRITYPSIIPTTAFHHSPGISPFPDIVGFCIATRLLYPCES